MLVSREYKAKMMHAETMNTHIHRHGKGITF